MAEKRVIVLHMQDGIMGSAVFCIPGFFFKPVVMITITDTFSQVHQDEPGKTEFLKLPDMADLVIQPSFILQEFIPAAVVQMNGIAQHNSC